MAWFRVYGDDILNDKKLKRIARELGIPLLQVKGAWLDVLCLASESPVRGVLMYTSNEQLTTEDVSETFHVTFHETEVLLQAFRNAEMLADDGTIINWDKRQFESDLSTERVRKHREMKRFSNVSETHHSRTEQIHSRAEAEQNDAPRLRPLSVAYMQNIKHTSNTTAQQELNAVAVEYEAHPLYQEALWIEAIENYASRKLADYKDANHNRYPGLKYICVAIVGELEKSDVA